MAVVPFPSYRNQPGQNVMQIRAKTKTGAVEFNAEPGESILYAGLRNGVPLPYECATGTCGTCKARRGTGEVNVSWAQAPGASFIKAERGDFADVPGHPAVRARHRDPRGGRSRQGAEASAGARSRPDRAHRAPDA